MFRRAQFADIHRDEVLAADDAERLAEEGDFNASREGLGIQAAKTAEQIDLIAVGVG